MCHREKRSGLLFMWTNARLSPPTVALYRCERWVTWRHWLEWLVEFWFQECPAVSGVAVYGEDWVLHQGDEGFEKPDWCWTREEQQNKGWYECRCCHGDMFNPHVDQGWTYIRYVCKELLKHGTFKSDLEVGLACFDYSTLFTLPLIPIIWKFMCSWLAVEGVKEYPHGRLSGV